MQEQQTPQDKNKQNAKAPKPTILQSFHDKNIDYDALKKEAIEKSPLVATYPLSSFELGRNKTIKMFNKIIPVTKQAYFNFLKKVLRVDPQFVRRFKDVTDEKTEINMLQTLKTGMTLKKDQQVHILANPKNAEITNFASGHHAFRTNEQLLTIFENVMNKFGILKVRDFHMTSDGTLNIAARTDEVRVGPSGNTNEAFRGGLTFRNSYDSGSSIGHNAFRMVCQNGMFGFGDLPLFVGPQDGGKTGRGGGLIDFFEKLDELNAHGWMNEEFWDRLDDAEITDASVNELYMAKNCILNNSELEEKDLRSILPGYFEARKFLAKHKIDMEKLDGKKMVNCPTNVKVWELVNAVTDFGSHDYGFEQNFDRIQNGGGRLFAKHYDTKDLVHFS